MLVVYNNQHPKPLFKPQPMAKACTPHIHPYKIDELCDEDTLYLTNLFTAKLYDSKTTTYLLDNY